MEPYKASKAQFDKLKELLADNYPDDCGTLIILDETISSSPTTSLKDSIRCFPFDNDMAVTVLTDGSSHS